MRTLPRTSTAASMEPSLSSDRPACAVQPGQAAGTSVPTASARRLAGQWPGSTLLDVPETARVLHAAWSGDPAVVVPSPPGAGKTRLVVLLAAALSHRADLRVGVAAQTRAQAVQIAERLGVVSDRALLLWATSDLKNKPTIPGTPVVHGAQGTFPAERGGCVVATTARWLAGQPSMLGCDVLVVDEAWQATYADLGALGAFTGSVVCVGDPGQIDPVVTGRTARWRLSSTGPHLPAPDALRAAHGDAIDVVALRHTWRLGPQTTALIQPVFYRDLPFASRRPHEYLTDAFGADLPEVAHRMIRVDGGPGDPTLARACADRVRSLLGTTLNTGEGSRPVIGADIAVVCPHVQQAAGVRALLADEPDVLVGTANQMQGLERPAAVAMHPLAGYRDISEFVTDTGRMCVTLSRHRAHLTVVMDKQTQDTLRRGDDATATTAHGHLADALLNTTAV